MSVDNQLSGNGFMDDISTEINEIQDKAEAKSKNRLSDDSTYRPPEHYESKLAEIEDKLDEINEQIESKSEQLETVEDSLSDKSIDEIEDNTAKLNGQIRELEDQRERFENLRDNFKGLLREARENEQERENLQVRYQRELASEQLLPALTSDLDSALDRLLQRFNQLQKIDRELSTNHEATVKHYILSNLRKRGGMSRIDTAMFPNSRYRRNNLSTCLGIGDNNESK
jgi:DNA repair exonuclease SbcCD ATPase subunit